MDLLEFIRSVGLEFLLGFFVGWLWFVCGGVFSTKQGLKWSAIMVSGTRTYKYTTLCTL